MMEFLHVLAVMAVVCFVGLMAYFVFASLMYWFVVYPIEVIKNMFDKNHPDYWRRI